MEKIKKFLFGERRKYRVEYDEGWTDVAGTSYRFTKNGRVTVRDCFSKVATFLNAKRIIEL